MHTHDLDAKIATLEAELQRLKQQRAQGQQPKALDGIRVVEQSHPTAGTVKVIGMPVKFSETPGDVGSAAPRLGEHSAEILRGLGYTATDIEQLRQEQVISVGGA